MDKKNVMNVNVNTLNEISNENDIIITLNLAPIMPQRKQIRLVEKFHIISDSDYGYKHVYLYKPTVKSPNYMLGIDFRNVFFQKRLYFNMNIISYINACKSYALNTYLALIDECFGPEESEEIKMSIKTAFRARAQRTTGSSVADALQVHLVKDTVYPIAHYVIGYELMSFNKTKYANMLDNSIMELNEKSNVHLESVDAGNFSYTDMYASKGGLIGGHIFFNKDVTTIQDFIFSPFLGNTKIIQILEDYCSSRKWKFDDVLKLNNQDMDKWLNKHLVRVMVDICHAIKLPELNTELYMYFTRKMDGAPIIHHKYYTMR